jgi:oligoribonuclease NrnB/cAMP/cGMP phosphodiesterase (DHH superfamily)
VVKLFTHTDLDGVGCAVLAQLLWGRSYVNIDFCDYKDLANKIRNFHENAILSAYTDVLVTDLHINRELTEILNRLHSPNRNVLLIDHHETSLPLREHSWAMIEPGKESEPNSATSLMFDVYKNKFLANSKYNTISEFVYLVRLYDTWRWEKDKVFGANARMLNSMLQCYKRDKFIETILMNIRENTIFSDEDLTAINLYEANIEDYVRERARTIVPMRLKSYNIGVVFADLHVSHVGNYVAKHRQDLDFVAIVSLPDKVNLRGIKEDIHLGEIAKEFGGGGHPRAAGFVIRPDQLNKVIFNLLEE